MEKIPGSASDPAVGWGARNMKSMWPPLAAIFFMTCLYRAGGGHGPLGTPPPPGSATVDPSIVVVPIINFDPL